MEAREDCVKMVRLPSPLDIVFETRADDQLMSMILHHAVLGGTDVQIYSIRIVVGASTLWSLRDCIDTSRLVFYCTDGGFADHSSLLETESLHTLHPFCILNSNTSILVVSPFSSLHFIRILPPLAFSLPTTGLARYLPPFRQRRLRNYRSKRITRRSARIRILITSRDGQKARKTIRTTPTTWS